VGRARVVVDRFSFHGMGMFWQRKEVQYRPEEGRSGGQEEPPRARFQLSHKVEIRLAP